MKLKHSILLLLILFLSPALPAQKLPTSFFKPIADTLQCHFKKQAYVTGKISIDSVVRRKTSITIYFNQYLSEYSLTKTNVDFIYKIAKELLPQEYKELNLSIHSCGSPISHLVIPTFDDFGLTKKERKKREKDYKESKSTNLLVKNISKPYSIDKGLNNRHLAIWQSHGFYYEQKLLRWEWQRARIFQTVEDLYTQSYVLPFLVPMLENAGAVVMLPRERDVQKNEIIVDNDQQDSGYFEENGSMTWTNTTTPGFADKKVMYETGENPFEFGTSRQIESSKNEHFSTVRWAPKFPESGEYAVYVSYLSLPKSTSSAEYTVYHKGGSTTFKVNQKMGGKTWIYLGTFPFEKGRNSGQYVILTNKTGKKGEIITADAVKFGGGMGNIARKPSDKGSEMNRKSSSNEPIQKVKIDLDAKPETSGYPRFTEGARYWLQWAGFNDTIYSPNRNSNDYNDDYMSRGRWVNVLSGGSRYNPEEIGYNIPLDMAFAFHTDAGTTLDNSIIGTLGIYTRFSNGSDKFPNGERRINSRYLTDLIQSQIVDDVRKSFSPEWQRRGIWDKSYSESRSPKVPTMLLELLSHQNFADMRYGLNPEFRFIVSRAIYKGIIKYFSNFYNIPYVIQPLPVKNFAAILDGDKVNLSWDAVLDTLEPTATPTKYIVYTRKNDGGFDNGRVIEGNKTAIQIEPGEIYSFKIAALNDGGESFPSEILSVFRSKTSKEEVLIVNCFDRVSEPTSFASSDSSFAGFTDNSDHGVPYIKDISYIGSQYEFRRHIPWMDDDSPGFGASYADYETRVIAGNTFDYPYTHGKAFKNNGFSFSSISRDALNKIEESNKYKIIDFIFGKQAQTKTGTGKYGIKYKVFPAELQRFISLYSQKGGNILLSGSYIATDVWDSYETDSLTRSFVEKTLRYQWRTHYASKTGEVKAVQSPYNFGGNFSLHTKPNEEVYCTEAPDALEPIGPNAWTVFRYADNNISAATAFKGDYKVVALGFPIETLKTQEEIDSIINMIINFFK